MKLSNTITKALLGVLAALVAAVITMGTATMAQAAIFNIADGDVAGLIAAINTANGNGVADTINLAAGGTYTLTMVDNISVCSGGSNGLPSITSEITINGNGAIIERSAAGGIPFFRIFCVSDNLTLNDVTVSGGGSPTATSFAGSVLIGGGISTRFGVPALVTLNNSTVSGNTATSSGGGIFIRSGSTLILNSSTVSGNTAGVMPGSGTGGGISNFGSATITNSTVSGNTATSNGGGIAIGFAGTVTLTNSTVSGNSGQFGAGGINHSFFGTGTVTIKNTIVANSTGGDCAGVITIEGNNFVESPGACVIVGSGTVNGGFDPLLGPLADNGGPTQTHALLSGSPAIDAGSGDCPPPATDQRGVARPQGAACDIGAYEFVDPPNQSPVAQCQNVTVSTEDGLCSASVDVNDGSFDPDGDPFTLDQDPAGPYPLGATMVTLTVTDDNGAFDSCQATVTVEDNEEPVLTCPDSQIIIATGPAVAFFGDPAVADNCGGFILPPCSSLSESTFPVGANLVTCTATDIASNEGSCDFTVTVQTPADATQDIVTQVENLDLPQGTENSMTSKLDAAINSLDMGQDNAAANQLNALINQLNALSGNQLTEGEAAALVALIEAILAAIVP